MAKITIDGQTRELPDGAPILDTCELLGVPFGCQAGQCATCVIRVQQGMENLEPMNGAELEMGLGKGERLACQARIKAGEVVATW